MRSILGIDTGSRRGSIALAVEGRTTESRSLPPGGHSSGLASAARDLLESAGLSMESLGGIGVSAGPGSFTGLRIGLAWAKGVALGASIPLALVSSHEAYAHAFRHGAGRLVTLLPGERGCVEAARWILGERLELDGSPERIAIEALPDVLAGGARAGAGVRIIAGDAPPDALEGLRRAGCGVTDATGGPDGPPPIAASVAALGRDAIRDGRAADWAAAAPSYGRAPNARKPAP